MDVMFFSMQFNLLLATKTIFCVFSFFSLVFKSFLAIALLVFSVSNGIAKKTMKLRLKHIIPTDAPITVANQAIETPALVADKTNQVLVKLCLS